MVALFLTRNGFDRFPAGAGHGQKPVGFFVKREGRLKSFAAAEVFHFTRPRPLLALLKILLPKAVAKR